MGGTEPTDGPDLIVSFDGRTDIRLAANGAFTIGRDGRASEATVVEASPTGVFDRAALDARFTLAAQQPVQPEIHVHADAKTKYETVAAVLTAAQRQGLLKIGVVGLGAYANP